MLTAQDIREKTFESAKFNGYDKASVDDFLDDLADDLAAAQKENAVLKSKMKVLVDKIEEYRANEEALNMAILSAQKLAVQIESDARTRASAMIAEAEKTVEEEIGTIKEKAVEQEKRLADAEAATKKFCDSVRAMCLAQIKNIDAISGEAAEEEAAPAEEAVTVDDAVRSIESSVAQIMPEAQIEIDLSDIEASPAMSDESTQPFNF